MPIYINRKKLLQDEELHNRAGNLSLRAMLEARL
jgi:hypothetical protein